MVLEQGKKVTGRQPNKQGIQLFVTGIPIHDEEGAIVYVVSFSSWDIQSMEELEEKYLRIRRDLCRCSSENRALLKTRRALPCRRGEPRHEKAL